MQSSSFSISAPVQIMMSFLLMVALLIDQNSTLKMDLGFSSMVLNLREVSEKSTFPQVVPFKETDIRLFIIKKLQNQISHLPFIMMHMKQLWNYINHIFIKLNFNNFCNKMNKELTITKGKRNKAKKSSKKKNQNLNSSQFSSRSETMNKEQNNGNNNEENKEKEKQNNVFNSQDQQTKLPEHIQNITKISSTITPKKEPKIQQDEIMLTKKKNELQKELKEMQKRKEEGQEYLRQIEQVELTKINSIKSQRQNEENKLQRIKSQRQNNQNQLRKIQQAVQINQAPQKAIPQNQRTVLRVSVCEKLILSVIGTFIILLFFTKPAHYSGQLMEVIKQEYTPTFQIASLKVSQKILFQIQNTQPIFSYLPFHSTKIAQIQAQVLMRMGYEVEKVQSVIENNGDQNIRVRFSDMKVLSYDIKKYQFNKKQHGYFNSWEIQEVRKIEDYVQQNYIPEVKQKAIQSLNQQQKIGAKRGSQMIVGELVNKHQPWFTRVIRNINYQVDEIIQQYLPKIAPAVIKDEFIQNDVIVFKNQTQQNGSYIGSFYDWAVGNATEKPETKKENSLKHNENTDQNSQKQ